MDQPEECGFEAAMKVIRGKWKATIIWRLHVAPRRFGRLRQLLPGISDKVLLDHLRELEADGLVERRQEAGPPVKVVYSLSEYGRSLNDGMEHLAAWGRAHQRIAAGRTATPTP
jgi:DNA-binding HxlR family transcriptional regulator